MEAILQGAVLAEAGFQTVGRNDLIQRINSVSPNGQTAFRDAVLAGIQHILRLNQTLSQLGDFNWQLVQIVLTDGVDNASKANIGDLVNIFQRIGNQISPEKCKTIFISVDTKQNPEAMRDIQILNQAGGRNTQAYQVDNFQVGQIFQSIQLELGVRQNVRQIAIQGNGGTAVIQQVRNQPMISLRRNRFAVVFNLDISGSMDGKRWNTVRQSIQRFVNEMNDDDLVSCLVFNDKVTLLTRQQAQARKVERSPSPSRSAMNLLAQVFSEMVIRRPQLSQSFILNFK